MPPQPNKPTPPAVQQSSSVVTFAPVQPGKKGHRILLYGTGGIGKTSLACLAPGPVAFVDADESLEILCQQIECKPVRVPVSDFKSLRDALKSSGWDNVKTIVLDTATKIEEWAVAETLRTVKHEKGHPVQSVEDYGFGKGFQFVFDTFLPLLADLDRHVREGRNVILIAHDCTSNVPNPTGEDWLRYEPRLQAPASGKASIRARLKEWCDHVLFLGYDVVVAKDGKAQGSGTRTLHASELPHCMAKSRTFAGTVDVVNGESPWENFIK